MKFKNLIPRSGESYVYLTGGLGNQLFQYAAALSGNPSSVKVLTAKSSSKKVINKTPDLFQFDLPIETFEIGKIRLSTFTKKYLGFLLRLNLVCQVSFVVKLAELFGISVLYFSTGKIFYLKVCRGIGFSGYPKTSFFPTFLVGYYQSEKYFKLSSVIDKMKSIAPLDDLETIDKYMQKSKSDKPLIVHVRLSDYRFENNFGILTPNYYSTALNVMSDKVQFNRIWLFSDEPDEALSYIPDLYHNNCEIIPLNNKSACINLEVMRFGVGYIIANSSFSWWAASLSKITQPVVIYPEPWFKNLGTPTGLAPSHWIKISGHD